MQKLVPFLLTSILFIAGVGYAQRTGKPVQTAVANTALASTPCDESLWKHVYIGDRRRFDKPEDRLKIIDRCRTVTGTIVTSVPKPDGDSHVQILLDPQFKDMLNARNKSTHLGQHGFLVIEPICQQEPTQDDTVKEGVCHGFRQTLPAMVQIKANIKKHIGTRVEVTGAFVTDMEHRWNEIHPVTSIVIAP